MRSPVARLALLVAGHVCVGLAVLGIFLPLLPATGPLLIAAACYARASTRFHQWLLANRTFGPMIADWQQHRSIARRHKISAIALIVITMGTTIIFFTNAALLRVTLVIIGVSVITFLLRVRTTPTGNLRVLTERQDSARVVLTQEPGSD